MKTKHTPGPWRGELDGPLNKVFQGSIYCDSHHDEDVAVTWGETAEEAEANTNLIATTPEMLDVLSDALETMNILLNEMPKEEVVLRHEIAGRKLQIEAIIQKATS